MLNKEEKDLTTTEVEEATKRWAKEIRVAEDKLILDAVDRLYAEAVMKSFISEGTKYEHYTYELSPQGIRGVTVQVCPDGHG